LVTLVILTALGYWTLTSYTSFRNHSSQGDVVVVGGDIPLNVNGRAKLWGYTWHGFLAKPVFGHGVGSVERAVSSISSTTHPHNDFLRLLFDFGLIGTGLWCYAYARIVREILRRKSHERADVLTFAARLATLAIPLSMITDNVIVYSFVVAPAGALIGLALGQSDDKRLGAMGPARVSNSTHLA
jgi:O-antigen ligase